MTRSRLYLAGIGLAGLVAGGVLGLSGIASAAPVHAAAPDMNSTGRTLLKARLAASVPSDPAIFGVVAGGIPWQMADGHAHLGTDGHLRVSVARLIDPVTHMNPLPYIAASVYCGGTLAATTAPVPFSPQGNAQVHATVMLPAFCAAPAVLLNPATGPAPADVKAGVYIAFDDTVGS